MKHRVNFPKLHRKRDQRLALIRNMANHFILQERITTTKAKAKATQRYVEKLITKAKKQNLAAFRIIRSRLPQVATQKVYYDLAKRYETRKGGYTRILKLETTKQKDGSSLVILDLVK
ncbi:MAG: 50S ribosomal protein L17 [Candidatus Pacebacteria bacterium]|nr:50S ribosomal protein L17 [Candidatus Paceibacterota bacterium]